MMECCKLYNMIPKQEIERVLNDSSTASAELCYDFLGFENVYEAVTKVAAKHLTIIDLGCAYAAQAYFFTEYKRYIGVDSWMDDGVHFQTPNMDYYHESIQSFIARLDELKIDPRDCFAICSYVPDEEAQELVRKTFPYCLVYYPTKAKEPIVIKNKTEG